MVYVVCAPVAIPATVWCWCCPYFTGSRKVSRQEWLAMVSKLRRGVRGSRVKSVQKESWRARCQLMGDRSGRINSAQNRKCGRDGVAGAATMISRQGCVGSTGKRLPRGLENRLRALRLRAEKRTKETLRVRSFGPRSSFCKIKWRSRAGRARPSTGKRKWSVENGRRG